MELSGFGKEDKESFITNLVKNNTRNIIRNTRGYDHMD